MKRIAIIGAAGTGKSTLAKEQGNILTLPVYHIDAIFWKPGWVQMPEKELELKLKELVLKDNWIIDGNYIRTMDIRLRGADTIIFLDYPTYIGLFRVIKRRIMYHGKTRPDMGKDCKEKIDLEFIKWIINFRHNMRPGILEKLNKVRDDKKLHIFKSPSELRNYLVQLNEEITMTV